MTSAAALAAKSAVGTSPSSAKALCPVACAALLKIMLHGSQTCIHLAARMQRWHRKRWVPTSSTTSAKSPASIQQAAASRAADLARSPARLAGRRASGGRVPGCSTNLQQARAGDCHQHRAHGPAGNCCSLYQPVALSPSQQRPLVAGHQAADAKSASCPKLKRFITSYLGLPPARCWVVAAILGLLAVPVVAHHGQLILHGCRHISQPHLANHTQHSRHVIPGHIQPLCSRAAHCWVAEPSAKTSSARQVARTLWEALCCPPPVAHARLMDYRACRMGGGTAVQRAFNCHGTTQGCSSSSGQSMQTARCIAGAEHLPRVGAAV